MLGVAELREKLGVGGRTARVSQVARVGSVVRSAGRNEVRKIVCQAKSIDVTDEIIQFGEQFFALRDRCAVVTVQHARWQFMQRVIHVG